MVLGVGVGRCLVDVADTCVVECGDVLARVEVEVMIVDVVEERVVTSNGGSGKARATLKLPDDAVSDLPSKNNR